MNVRAPRSAGFTIVETLIVLAVTGALFVSAALMINGRQRQTAFSQSIRDIQSQLQETVNQVGSGNYDGNGSITCKKLGGKPVLTSGAPSSLNDKGDCTFLGKVIQFAVGSNDPEQYNIYTLVGVRNTTANAQTNLGDSGARLVARSSSDDTNVPDAYETKKLQYGLTVSKKYYDSHPFRALGLTSGIVNPGSTDTAQQANVVLVPGSGLYAEKTAAVFEINKALPTATINPVDGVRVCFNSGGTDQSGLITVGGAGRVGASVTLKIFEKVDCQ